MFWHGAISFIIVGGIFTALVQIFAGWALTKIGKEKVDYYLPPYIVGTISIIIGLLLAGDAIGKSSSNWLIAFILFTFVDFPCAYQNLEHLK